MRKSILALVSLILFITVLSACGKEENDQALSEDKLLVGVTGGPHEEIFEIVKEVAAEDGLEIELKVFSDYIMPNTALSERELDANSYQHKPFMDKFNEDHDTDLASAFSTVLATLGVYSNTLTDVNDITEGGKIGIANDPTNGARALVLFEDAGLIELDEDKKETATPLDITKNDLDLEFVELDAAQLPKMLDELDLAVINGNFATSNGLDPTKDSLYSETTGLPYVNHLVIRAENEDDPVIEKLKKAYQSEEVTNYINETYPGVYEPSWE